MTFSQSAFGELDYTVDWTDWLAGDTIASATVTEATPLTVALVTNTTTTVVVWLNSTACAVGDLLPVRFNVVTAGGRKESVTAYLAIIE